MRVVGGEDQHSILRIRRGHEPLDEAPEDLVRVVRLVERGAGLRRVEAGGAARRGHEGVRLEVVEADEEGRRVFRAPFEPRGEGGEEVVVADVLERVVEREIHEFFFMDAEEIVEVGEAEFLQHRIELEAL